MSMLASSAVTDSSANPDVHATLSKTEKVQDANFLAIQEISCGIGKSEWNGFSFAGKLAHAPCWIVRTFDAR